MNAGLPLSWFGLAAAASFVLGALATRAAISIAPRIGFVDKPGGHKSHSASKPYGGGTAVFVAAWLPLLIGLAAAVFVPVDALPPSIADRARDYLGGLRERAHEGFIILAGGIILHLLGLFDDIKPLGPGVKLPVILGVAFCVSTFADVRVLEIAGPLPSIALATLWCAVIINAFNFLDNMDGLSAGIALICLLALLYCGWFAGQVLVPAVAAVLAGGVAGFLWFNFPPARIFMGDAGSLLIGYAIAVLSIRTTYYPSGAGQPPFALAMPLCILAVPLYDFCTVIGIRIAEGRNPLKGDQRHFSHRLVEHGLSRRFAVVTIYIATAATALAATLLPGANLRETLTVMAIVLSVLTIIGILERPVAKTP